MNFLLLSDVGIEVVDLPENAWSFRRLKTSKIPVSDAICYDFPQEVKYEIQIFSRKRMFYNKETFDIFCFDWLPEIEIVERLMKHFPHTG